MDKWKVVSVANWRLFPLPVAPKDLSAPIAFIDIHGSRLYEERLYELGDSDNQTVFIECAMFYVDPVVIQVQPGTYGVMVPESCSPFLELWKDSLGFTRMSVTFTLTDVGFVKKELQGVADLFANFCMFRRMVIGSCLWDVLPDISSTCTEFPSGHDVLTCTVHLHNKSIYVLHLGNKSFMAKVYQAGQDDIFQDLDMVISKTRVSPRDGEAMRVIFQAPIQSCRTTTAPSDRAIVLCSERI